MLTSISHIRGSLPCSPGAAVWATAGIVMVGMQQVDLRDCYTAAGLDWHKSAPVGC